MKKETIALNPVERPKNNQQFTAPKLPYWKTTEYKNYIANGGDKQEYVKELLKKRGF